MNVILPNSDWPDNQRLVVIGRIATVAYELSPSNGRLRELINVIYQLSEKSSQFLENNRQVIMDRLKDP